MDTTFGMIKPDAVKRNIIGSIITRIEEKGFKIIRLQMNWFKINEAEDFYHEHKDQPYFNNLIKFTISGPIVGMYLTKENSSNVIEEFRTLIGATNPEKAAEGTIRKLFGLGVPNNSIHGSDSMQSYLHERQIFWLLSRAH